jgi:hypothetical protein
MLKKIILLVVLLQPIAHVKCVDDRLPSALFWTSLAVGVIGKAAFAWAQENKMNEVNKNKERILKTVKQAIADVEKYDMEKIVYAQVDEREGRSPSLNLLRFKSKIDQSSLFFTVNKQLEVDLTYSISCNKPKNFLDLKKMKLDSKVQTNMKNSGNLEQVFNDLPENRFYSGPERPETIHEVYVPLNNPIKASLFAKVLFGGWIISTAGLGYWAFVKK